MFVARRSVRPIRKHSHGESQASVQKNEQQQKKKKQPKNPICPQNPLLWPAGYMGPPSEPWGGWEKRLISIDHVLFSWLEKKKEWIKNECRALQTSGPGSLPPISMQTMPGTEPSWYACSWMCSSPSLPTCWVSHPSCLLFSVTTWSSTIPGSRNESGPFSAPWFQDIVWSKMEGVRDLHTSSLLPITTYKTTTHGFFQTTFISSKSSLTLWNKRLPLNRAQYRG